MHDTALELGRQFFANYLPAAAPPDRPATILDVGSLDVNGSLRQVLPEGRLVAYTGVDFSPGPGVDQVVESAARLPFDDGHFDVVVSTSAFEHDPAFWKTFDEMLRVVRPGGFIYINAPSNGHVHQHPLDCWRFYPDAGLALASGCNRSDFQPVVELVESFTFERMGCEWNDAVMVFAKLPLSGELPPPLCRDERAKNVRLRGHEGLGRYEPLTEDQRLATLIGTTTHHLMATLRAETAYQLSRPNPLRRSPFFTVIVRFDQATMTDEELDRCLASIRPETSFGVEVHIVHDGPLHRSSRHRAIYASDGLLEDPRALGLSLATGLYVLEMPANRSYAPGALPELAAALRAEPVGMLVCELDGALPDGLPEDFIDVRQVVLRLGVALAYVDHGQSHRAITDEMGFCRSRLVLGAR